MSLSMMKRRWSFHGGAKNMCFPIYMYYTLVLWKYPSTKQSTVRVQELKEVVYL